MTDESRLPSAERRGPSSFFATQRRVAVVGIAVAALIAAVALGFWSIAPRTSAQPTIVAPVSTSATPTPTPTVIAAAVVKKVDFKSSSGNLRCSIGQFSGQPGAICQQVNINYAVPWGACIDEDQKGVFVGVRPSGAYWPCVALWPEPVDVLPYDTPITQSGVTCTINLDAGVRCVNESGKGFTMEYNAGVARF